MPPPSAFFFGIATLLVALLTFVLTRRAPYSAPLCVVAAQIFGPSFAMPHTSLNFAKAAILAALIAIAENRRVAGLWSRRPAAAQAWTIASMLILASATLATYTVARYHGPVLRETAKTIEYVFAFVIGITSIRTVRDIRIVGLGLVPITALTVGLAVAQEWLGAPSVFRAGTHLVPRIAGPLEGPNQLAGFLGIVIPVLVAFAACGGPGVRDRRSWIVPAVVFGAAGADVLTFSRGGVGTLVISLATLAVWRFVKVRDSRTRDDAVRPALLAAAGGIVTGFVAAALISGAGIFHFGTTTDAGDTGSVGHRSQLWHAALVFFQRSPWLGIGAGNYENELAEVGLPHIHTHANSLYLQSLAEGGVVLFGATLLTVLVPLVFLARRADGADGAPDPHAGFAAQAAAAGALCAGIGLALHDVVDTLMFYPKVGLVWWLLIGCALASITAASPLQSTQAGNAEVGALSP